MRGRLGGALKFSFAQGLSSLTNYFLSLTLARSLAPAEFGAVSLMLTFAFFAVAAQRAVIGDPALAVGRRAMPMANSMHTILWVFALSASVAIAAAGFVILNWVALVPAAGAFLLVAQDGYRYIAVTKNRLRVVLASDGIWLSLGGAGVGLAVSYSEYGQLGVALWFAGGLLALTFIVAATARSAWPFEGPLYFFRSTRELSGWAALQFGVSNGAIQVTLSVVAVTIGFESFGGFRAIQVVVSPLQVAILALSSPLLSVLATDVDRTAGRTPWILAGALFGATGLLGALVWVFRVELISLIGGEQYVPYASLVAPALISITFVAATLPLTAAIQVRQRGRMLFVGSATAVVSTSALVVAVALAYNVDAVAWAMAIQYFCVMASIGSILLFVRSRDRKRCEPSLL